LNKELRETKKSLANGDTSARDEVKLRLIKEEIKKVICLIKTRQKKPAFLSKEEIDDINSINSLNDEGLKKLIKIAKQEKPALTIFKDETSLDENELKTLENELKIFNNREIEIIKEKILGGD